MPNDDDEDDDEDEKAVDDESEDDDEESDPLVGDYDQDGNEIETDELGRRYVEDSDGHRDYNY